MPQLSGLNRKGRVPFGGGRDAWVEWVILLQVCSGSAALARKPASGFAADISDDARAVAASSDKRIVIRSRFKPVFPGIVCNGVSR